MTTEELHTLRRARWATLAAGAGAANVRETVRELGFAIFAPRPGITLPALTELRADGGTERALEVTHAALEAALAETAVVELGMWDGGPVYVPATSMAYVYACVGDRLPQSDFKAQANRRRLSWLAAAVYERLLQEAPRAVTPAQLRDHIGAARTSALGVERALAELGLSCKAIRTGSSAEGTQWRALVAAIPAVPPRAAAITRVQASSALLSQWLDTMVCGTDEELATFFTPLFSHARVQAAVSGLLAGREVVLDSVEGRPAYRLADRPATPSDGASAPA